MESLRALTVQLLIGQYLRQLFRLFDPVLYRSGRTAPCVGREWQPRSGAFRCQNADELFAQKRYSAAIPLYRRVIELDPEDLDAYNDLGLALHYSGRSQAGLETLQEGAAKDPEFQRIWLTMGFVSAQAGDPAGAHPALEKARDLDPDNGIGQEATRMLGLLKGE